MSIAEKFRNCAQTLDGSIAEKRLRRRENTPKQMRQAKSARIEADHLERTKIALECLAEAHERGELLPESLKHFKTKAQVAEAMRTKIGSNSYYDVHDTMEFADKSDAAVALRAFVESKKSDRHREQQNAQATANRVKDLEARVKFLDIPGFFPTPDELADRVVKWASIRAGDTILEPSAGIGSLLDALRRVPLDFIGGLWIIEINPTLCEILRGKGYDVMETDFLTTTNVIGHMGGWDRIIMNPPFENGQDMDHVRHAYSLLKPGGRLVAIMSPSPFHGSNRKQCEFRDWFMSVGGEVEAQEPGQFKNSFRSTGVSCNIVIIDKENL